MNELYSITIITVITETLKVFNFEDHSNPCKQLWFLIYETSLQHGRHTKSKRSTHVVYFFAATINSHLQPPLWHAGVICVFLWSLSPSKVRNGALCM